VFVESARRFSEWSDPHAKPDRDLWAVFPDDGVASAGKTGGKRSRTEPRRQALGASVVQAIGFVSWCESNCDWA
jgi:hypothetical protein